MPPSYSYSPGPKPSIDWPKIIWAIFGILVIIVVFFLFIWKPLNEVSKRTNDFLNQSQNNSQGIAIGEPNPNGYNCSSDVYNCENFTTRAEAQYVFDLCFPIAGDVHHLDKDGDKKVCKMLP